MYSHKVSTLDYDIATTFRDANEPNDPDDKKKIIQDNQTKRQSRSYSVEFE